MRIRIRYSTSYRYEAEVGFSRHIFRLFPRQDQFVAVRALDFHASPDADVQHRRDLFDNSVAHCIYRERSHELAATLHLDLELREKNAFHFLLDPHAVEFPFQYEPRERAALEPYLRAEGGAELPFWKAPSTPQPTVSALVGLNNALHEHLRYERREEGAALSPAETLAAGAGACRDFALLLAETLRAHGVAARFASGYLCEFGKKERVAEGALHAWTEAYLPGAGWVGFDPTNGVLCTENHITAAVGLIPHDVSPISGTYYSDVVVPSEMTAKLEMERI